MMQVWVVVPKNFFIATVGEEKGRGGGGKLNEKIWSMLCFSNI